MDAARENFSDLRLGVALKDRAEKALMGPSAFAVGDANAVPAVSLINDRDALAPLDPRDDGRAGGRRLADIAHGDLHDHLFSFLPLGGFAEKDSVCPAQRAVSKQHSVPPASPIQQR